MIRKGAPTTVGERVAWAIHQSELSETDIAQRLEGKLVTQKPQVSRWKKGQVEVSTKNVLQLASILDVDGDWLLTGRGDPYRHKRMQVVQAALSAEIQELQAMIDALP